MAFTEGKTKRECCLFWGGRHGGADENKNSGDGDVRAIALWWDDELGKSQKTSAHFFSTPALQGWGLGGVAGEAERDFFLYVFENVG